MKVIEKRIKGYFMNCVSFKDQNALDSIGVMKKVYAQCDTLREHFDLTHELHNMYKKYARPIDKVIRRLPFTGISERWRYEAKYADADFIYFRKDVIDNSVYRFLRQIKKHNPKCKILLEIPTYPYDGEIKNGLKNSIFYIKDVLNRRKLHKCVDKIVTMSEEEKIFGISTVRIMNGLDFNKIKCRQYNNDSETIRMIAVSTFAKWHGFDRIIQGMGNYYKNGGTREMKFVLVGDGAEKTNYQKFTLNNNLSNRITFTGVLANEGLDEAYNEANLAINSLGLHKLDLFLSSTIKTREYGAKGLPIVSSTRIDYLPEKYRYLLSVPENDEPLDMQSVINFFDDIYNSESIEIVTHEIRKFAEATCNMKTTMQPVIECIISN